MATNIKYPYLPEGKEILYVSGDNDFIKQAKEMARTSNDQSFPTGAVIVQGGEVMVAVSNKTPLSNPKLKNLHKKYCIRRILGVPSGQKYWLCPGCASHENHAEYRASVEYLKKFKNKMNEPHDLYLWGHWWCCKPCWDKMIEANVKDVYLLEGSEILFDINNPGNIMGKQFE